MVVLVVVVCLLLAVGSIAALQGFERRVPALSEEERRANLRRIAEGRRRPGDLGRLELERRRRERSGG